MRSAIRTYALTVDVPAELPRHAVQPAAAHFPRGCAMCHGAPGEPRSPAALRMLPQPPDLAGVVGEWTDAELFRIVKHGVRFTGMPAWPTQARDDEVWAMVAFLREFPMLDRSAYRDLAFGGTPPPDRPVGFDEAIAECARCHGEDGLGRSAATPVIAAQSEAYLLESLRAYAEQRRASGVMSLPVVAVDAGLMPALARHYASQPARAPEIPPADEGLVSVGQGIFVGGVATAGVPACAGCHERAARNSLYPKLFGQRRDYVEQQLRLFRAGQRGGTAYNHLMTNAAKGLTDAQIEAVSVYLEAQAPMAATGNVSPRSVETKP